MGNDRQQLLSVTEAQGRLVSHFAALAAEELSLERAAGRVLAQEVRSALNIPPFPNSSMDGFAVIASDLSEAAPGHPVVLRVVDDIPAGQTSRVRVTPGQAARIMTGAPMPAGADAVVPVEDTDFNYRLPGVQAPEVVRIFRQVEPGDYVRPEAQDVHQGEVVMRRGVVLTPPALGFLAMLGVERVSVHRRPKVAVFSSGDELQPLGEPLQPGQIHDANTYTLVAAIEQAGAEALHLGIARDTAGEVQERLDRAVQLGADLILSSAGVSVGAFDFVRAVVEEGGRLDFWRVNMRPGKPLAFGFYRDVPFIGLPGNPVSAYVGFEVFVRPALAQMAGRTEWQRSAQRVELAEALESDGRESYLRAIVERDEGRLIARLTGHQGSGNLRSLVQANALIIVPSGVKSLPSGSQVDAWFLNEDL